MSENMLFSKKHMDLLQSVKQNNPKVHFAMCMFSLKIPINSKKGRPPLPHPINSGFLALGSKLPAGCCLIT